RLAADLIERSRADEKLRKSEERLRNAERLAHLGHWEWDLLTNRVSGSEEMYRIFGRLPDCKPSYEGFIQQLIPEDRARVEQAIGDSLNGKIGKAVEYRIARPNGDVRTISCVWDLSLDEAGLPVSMFGACQDITDSHRA